MKNTAKLLALLLALVMVLSLAACGGGDNSSAAAGSGTASGGQSDAGQPSGGGAAGGQPTGDKTTDVEVGSGKVLNGGFYLNETWIGSFDPTGAFLPGVCWGIKPLIYDSPTFACADGFTSRIFSEYGWQDPTTFYGVIKDEVCFNNGDPMTPEDIIWSFGFMANSWQASWYDFFDLENSYGEGQTLYLKTQFEYAAADSYINVAILNADVMQARIDAVGGDLTAIDSYALDFPEGIASGPYKCIESVTDSHAVYVLREDWWGMEEYGGNMTSQLNAYYYGDQTTMGIDLQNGKIDLALNVALTDAQRAYAGEYGNIQLGMAPQNGTYYIQFSDVCEVLKEVNVRKAIASCINLDEITAISLDMMGTPADCWFPSATEGYVPGLYYPYDLDAARNYLADSSYPDGCAINLLSDTDATMTTMAEAFQFYCQQIGVDVELNIIDPQSKGTIQTAGNVNSTMGHSGDNPAALSWNVINNMDVARYPDSDFTGRTDLMDLYHSIKFCGDFDQRVEMYHQMAQYIYENLIYIPLCEYSHSFLYNDQVIDIDNTFIASFIAPDVSQIGMK